MSEANREEWWRTAHGTQMVLREEIENLQAEIERLQAEVKRARADGARLFQQAAKGLNAIGVAALDPEKVVSAMTGLEALIDKEAGDDL